MLSDVERERRVSSYVTVSLAPVVLLQLAAPVIELTSLLTGAQKSEPLWLLFFNPSLQIHRPVRMPFSLVRSLSANPHRLFSFPGEEPHCWFGSFLSILPAWQDTRSAYPFVTRVRVLHMWGLRTLALLPTTFTRNSCCSLSGFASALFTIYTYMSSLFKCLPQHWPCSWGDP